jgi:hypothetical protein
MVSCNKSPFIASSGSISGKWLYKQYYYSIGGPPIYVSTDSARQWILFNADGSFSANVPGFANFKRYEMIDSSKIKFITPSQPGFRLFNLDLDATRNILTLSPADYICIEGCGNIFKRDGL